MDDKLSVFNYRNRDIRIVTDEQGEPWWVAKDVCDILNMTTEQTRRLDEDEKGLRLIQTPGGLQEMSVLGILRIEYYAQVNYECHKGLDR